MSHACRRAAKVLQRALRAWRARRFAAASLISAAARGFIVRCKHKHQAAAATAIQVLASSGPDEDDTMQFLLWVNGHMDKQSARADSAHRLLFESHVQA